MKTASMVMGIIGGSIALIVALVMIVAGAAFYSITDYSLSDWSNQWNFEYSDSLGGYDFQLNPSSLTGFAGGAIIFFAILSLFAGVLGLVGGIIAKKRNVAAGVLMIIAAPLSLFGYFNLLSMILFILGAVFAFVKEKPQYVPAPYQQYPQYPQYPQAQPQYPQPPEPQTPPQDEPKL